MFATGCSTKSVSLGGGGKHTTQAMPTVGTLRAISSMTAVGLEWKMVPDLKVEGYRIYRADLTAGQTKMKKVAEVDDRYSTHFVDTDLKPGTEYGYRISTYGDAGESEPSVPVKIRTSPMIASVSFVRAITDLPNRIKIIWRPHSDLRVTGYIVERAQVEKPKKVKKMGELKHRLSAEFMDDDLGDGEYYMYRVKCKLSNGLVTPPSEWVKAVTKPLPLPPTGLQATMNLPRMIRLSWQASPAKDVIYYKVYRSPFAKGFYQYRAKVQTTAFEDHIPEDGKTYYYKITAVDRDGLESQMPESPIVGMTLGRPIVPSVVHAAIDHGQAVIEWEPLDNRAHHFKVVRSYWDGLTRKKKVFNNITGRRLVDTSIIPGVKYTYRVYEVDANGIESEPSREIELSLPKPDGK